MGNELTTLVQIIISRMVRNVLTFKKKVHVDIWNDDFRAHGDIDDLIDYRLVDKRICEDLDYPLSEEKTRILYGATVFLEEYTFLDERVSYLKENRKICNLINMLFARNIHQAKEYSRSIYEETESLFIANVKVSQAWIDIVCAWGYEFHKNELILPARFGGWYTCKYCYLDESLVLRSFNETPVWLLNKLFEAENAELDLSYKKSYSFAHYSDKQIFDVRKMNDIERVFAPLGDIILNNNASIAKQTERGLTRSRLKILYFDLLYRERQRRYNDHYPEISRTKLIENVLRKDLFKSYAIPEMYLKLGNSFTEDYTFTSLQMRTTIVEEFNNQFKFLKCPENLSLIEKCKLISRSRLIASSSGANTYAIVPDLSRVDQKILKYYSNYRYSLTYYVNEYGAIPERIYLDIPDKFELLKISAADFDKFNELQNSFPSKLDAQSALNLDYFISSTKLDVENIRKLFETIRAVMERLQDRDYFLRIKRTLNPSELYEIVKKTADVEIDDDNDAIGDIDNMYNVDRIRQAMEDRLGPAAPEDTADLESITLEIGREWMTGVNIEDDDANPEDGIYIEIDGILYKYEENEPAPLGIEDDDYVYDDEDLLYWE